MASKILLDIETDSVPVKCMESIPEFLKTPRCHAVDRQIALYIYQSLLPPIHTVMNFYSIYLHNIIFLFF